MISSSKTKMYIDHSFNGCRFVQCGFECNRWTLKVCVQAFFPEDETEDDFIKHLTASFQKLRFFSTNVMADVFVISNKDMEAFITLMQMDIQNNMVLLPENSTDDVFCQALHKKLSVICGDHLNIEEVSLRCEESNTTFTYTNIEKSDYQLPKMEEFITHSELCSAHDLPWWDRYDCDTHEILVPNSTSAEDKEEIISQLCTKSILDSIDAAVDEGEQVDGKGKSQVISMTEVRETWVPRQV